jgi:epoxyqueuosine reductase
LSKPKQDPREWITGLVNDFIQTSELNNLQNQGNDPAWDQALVGFASGADPIFQEYKEYVGAFHWTPWEVYSQHQPGHPARPAELSVISWVLPQRQAVREANRRAKKYPAEDWARVRVLGEACNAALREHIAQKLTEAGHPAVPPMQVSNWTWVRSQKYSYASAWSERHVAHAAGLGTFGLCDGLITPKGKAMRVGSVVARIQLEPTPRPYAGHQDYCSYYVDGSCGKCIDRCPARAITTDGHDKEKCRQYLLKSRVYVKKTYHYEGYGCGLCQVGVPCESRIPVKKAREAYERGELPPPPGPIA